MFYIAWYVYMNSGEIIALELHLIYEVIGIKDYYAKLRWTHDLYQLATNVNLDEPRLIKHIIAART